MSVQNGERLATKQDLADMYSGILPYLGGMPEVLANKFSKGDLYSTDEKMIGQWIDGKPLYQKTVVCSTGSTVNEWSRTAIGASVGHVSCINAVLDKGNGITFSIFPVFTSNLSKKMLLEVNGASNTSTPNQVGIYTDESSWLSKNVYTTIQYTKTTDTAISIGDETDYSTTEKIIGTWLNGEPLYQRTYEITSPSSANAQVVVTNLSYIQNCVKIDGLLASALPINWVFENGRRITTWFDPTSKQVYMDCTSTFERNLSGIITLQYTKSNS